MLRNNPHTPGILVCLLTADRFAAGPMLSYRNVADRPPSADILELKFLPVRGEGPGVVLQCLGDLV
jgi:hypothetical protein